VRECLIIDTNPGLNGISMNSKSNPSRPVNPVTLDNIVFVIGV